MRRRFPLYCLFALPIIAADNNPPNHVQQPTAIVFSSGFTDGVVLNSAPSKSAIYGFVRSASAPSVTATLVLDDGMQVRIPAVTTASGAGGGSTCDATCWASGYTSSVGDNSGCNAPSCSMGCIFGVGSTASKCADDCAAAKNKCSFTVNRTLGKWDMSECGGAPGGCPKQGECEAGCGFAFPTVTEWAWKVLLPPQAAGARGAVNVSCETGCEGAQILSAALRNVTFGSVFLCFGQSNMALFSRNTFDFENVSAAIAAGAYANLHLFQLGSMGYKNEADVPNWATTALAPPFWPWLSAYSAVNYSYPDRTLASFPATCLYFALSLIDLLGEEAPPIGLIATAVGGTTIESWSDADTYSQCAEAQTGNSAAPPITLFNGLTAPFVNTTLSGWVLFQGENNAGNPGSSLSGTGYGCQMPKLVSSYRTWWSIEPDTTPPLAPFGLVTLAADTSEGNGKSIAAFRSSQVANLGVLPNDLMPNTFLAHAFDLGDPWSQYENSHNCSKPPRPADCTPFSSAGFDPSLLPLAKAIDANVAPEFMGAIHPRIKSPVGRRLAHALFHGPMGRGDGSIAFTGPTIARCAVGSGALLITYNATLLRGEDIRVAEFDSNMTTWGVSDSSSFMVCYPSLGEGDCLTNARLWRSAAAVAGSTPGTVELTLPIPASTAAAVRYGWPLTDEGDTCCPFKTSTSGLAVCVPGACPVKTGTSWLPGNPFYANITSNGVCACLLPQVCD